MVRTFQLVASVLALATAAQAFLPPTPVQGKEALTRVNLWGNFGGGNKKAESTSSSKPMAQGTKKPAAPPAPAAKKSPFSFGGGSKPAAAAPPKAAPKAPVRPPLPKAPAAKAPPAAPKGAATSKMGMKAFSKNSDDMLGKKRPTAMDYRGMVVTEDEEVIVPATDYFANKSDPIVPTIAFALFGVIFGLLGWWLFSPVPEPQAVDPNAKTSYEQYMQQSRSSSRKF